MREIEFKEGRYEIGLPWKQIDDKPLPNDFQLSLDRLNSLFSRLEKDPEILAEYTRIIDEQIKLGIVEYVPEEEQTREFIEQNTLLIKPETTRNHPNPPETTRTQPETIRNHPNPARNDPKPPEPSQKRPEPSQKRPETTRIQPETTRTHPNRNILAVFTLATSLKVSVVLKF